MHKKHRTRTPREGESGKNASTKRRGPTVTPFEVYWQTAHVLMQARAGSGSAKTLSLRKHIVDKKATLALASQTLKYEKVVNRLIHDVQIVPPAKKHDKSRTHHEQVQCYLRILVYDFLIGMKSKQPRAYMFVQDDNTGLCDLVMQNIKVLKQALYELRMENGVIRTEDLLDDSAKKHDTWLQKMPKYIRVNVIKMDVNAVLKHFVELGFEMLDQNITLDVASQRTEKWIKLDDIVPHLIALGPPSSIRFHSDPLFRDSSIIIQDKSSCLPVHALRDTMSSLGIETESREFEFIDACAAPGNKTTYLASLYPSCKVIAFDRDQRRAVALKDRVNSANASNVEVRCADFLTTNPSDFENVRAFVLDPSCSGSGLVTREVSRFDQGGSNGESTDIVSLNDKELKRVEKLAEFQQQIVEHALSFKNVQVLAYSTCSIHWQENENVVARVLETYGHQFTLYKALPQWQSRGQHHAKLHDDTDLNFSHIADKLIRTYPEQHYTNGFFVACFVRKDLLLHADPPKDGEATNAQDENEKEKKEKKKMSTKKRKNKTHPTHQTKKAKA